jgi:transposase InsO family protein
MKAKCEFVRENSGDFSIKQLCQAVKLSAVSYYRSLNRARNSKSKEDQIAKLVEEVFSQHRRRYGLRPIHAELRARGVKVGRHRVRRLMRQKQLRAIQPKSFVPRTTESRHKLGYSENLLLNMQLPPPQMRTIIVSGITYLSLESGEWGYLVTWMDLFSRRILGWAIRERMDEELLLRATRMMLKHHRLAKRAILHSDRGGQYAGKRYRSLLAGQKLRQSMSRAGETYDNAYAESLFSRYKAELLESESFSSIEEAELETFNYIEGYYNRIRRHSSLGYLSPEEYEKKKAAERDEKLSKRFDKESP